MYLDSVRSGHIRIRSKHTFTSDESVEGVHSAVDSAVHSAFYRRPLTHEYFSFQHHHSDTCS